MPWEDRIAAPLAWGYVTISVAVIFVVLRFISRGYILRVLGPTDWAIAASGIISILFTAVTISEINSGYGYHIWEVTPEQLVLFYKMCYFSFVLYGLATVATKVSILLLYLDIFNGTTLRRTTYAVLAAVAIWGTWTLFSSIFFCWPIRAFWHTDMTEKTCLPRAKFFVEIWLHFALDFIIFLLPIPVIRSMTLPARQKLWLYFVFALGFLICLVIAVRIYYMYRTLTSSDATWEAMIIVILCFIELNLSIVIPCLLTLRPLVDKVFPNLLAHEASSRRPNSDGSPRDDDSIHPPTISSPMPRLAAGGLEMQEV